MRGDVVRGGVGSGMSLPALPAPPVIMVITLVFLKLLLKRGLYNT